MKFGNLLIFWVVAISKEYVTAYRTDIEDDQEAAFCQYRKHLTFKPGSTCCNGEVIKPALDIYSNMDECSSGGSSSITIEKISWDIYKCVLKKLNTDKDGISMADFAKLIYANYPQAIIDKIEEKLKDYSTLDASFTDTDTGRLEKMRVTYYDIERQVCDDEEATSIGTIQKCSSIVEENHRSGMCCSKSYPYDIRHNTVFDVDTLTPSSIETCKKIVIPNSPVTTEAMQNSMVEVCGVMCYIANMHPNSNIHNFALHKRDYLNFNLTEVFGYFKRFLVPVPFLSQVDKVYPYMEELFEINKTVEAIQEFRFADVTKGGNTNTPAPVNYLTWVRRGSKELNDNFGIDYMGHGFSKEVIHIPIMCAAINQLVSLAEDYFYKDCIPVDVSEVPPAVADDPPTTEQITESAITDQVTESTGEAAPTPAP